MNLIFDSGENSQNTPSNKTEIKDISEQEFMQEVVEASQNQLVLVDFWAPWCGPCKSFTPILKQVVASYQGRVKLVLLNIDENKVIPTQLGIQSIPAVMAFFKGQPVNGFMGALPESQIRSFIEKLLKNDPESAAIEQLEEQGKAALAMGQIAPAKELFQHLIEKYPNRVEARLLLAKCYLAENDFDYAKSIIESLPAEEQSKTEAKQILTLIELFTEFENIPLLSDLSEADIDKAKSTYSDLENYTLALFRSGQAQEAVDWILEFLKNNKESDDFEKAKTLLLKLFETFEPSDPILLKSRRQLSSMLFS